MLVLVTSRQGERCLLWRVIYDSVEARDDILATHCVQGSIDHNISRFAGIADRLGGGQRHQGEGKGEYLAYRHCDKEVEAEKL